MKDKNLVTIIRSTMRRFMKAGDADLEARVALTYIYKVLSNRDQIDLWKYAKLQDHNETDGRSDRFYERFENV